MATIEMLVEAQAQQAADTDLSELDRAQLEARLEEVMRRLAMFDATERVANIGHYEWSKVNGRLESCSPAYARLFDMSVEEVLASHDTLEKTLSLIHPEDRDHYRRATQAMAQSGRLDVDYRLLLANGKIRHVRESAISILDDAGVDLGSFGLMRDITRQVEYERDLEYRDDLARQSEELTEIGHFIFDEEAQRFTYVSEGYARIQGMSVAECIASVNSFEDDLANIHEEDRERVAAEYRAYVASGENCTIEYRMRRPDGTLRWVRELGRAKTMRDGRVTQTLGVIQDITDQVAREQELSFRQAIANQAESITDIGYFLYDEVERRHLYVSQGQARILGLGVDDFRRRVTSVNDYLQYVYEPDRERLARIYCDGTSDESEWEVEYRVVRADGEIRWLREIGQVYKRSGELVVQTIGVVQDVTGQKEIEQTLRFKDTVANQAEAITEIGHCIYDEINQKYLFVSPGYERIFGVSAAELMARDMADEGALLGVHPDDRAQVQKVYDQFLAGGDSWQVEYRLLRADGEVRWVREMGRSHLVTHGIPEQTIGVLQDITPQKNAERELIETRDMLEQQVVERTRELANTVKELQQKITEHEKTKAELQFLANHDALTGLPSLRLCKDRLNQSLADARRKRQTSAVMFLDLDGFKAINDRHGHEFGDRVLRAIAERIASEIRETDTVARIGGDEFVVILSSIPQNDIARRIAASLVESIGSPLRIDDAEVAVSASIGISLYPDNGVTAEELIRSADKAMYCIKREGKNNFGFVDSALH